MGGYFQILPSLTLKQEYNSNLFLDEDDIKEDFIATISPCIKLMEKTERLDSELSAQINQLQYIDNHDLNATDQSYGGRARYSLTELLNVSAAAGYLTDSRPDRDITETGLALTKERRKRFNASMSADQRITEKARAIVSYAYAKDRYENNDTDDTLSHNVTGGLIYDFSKYISGLQGRVNMVYDRHDFTDSELDSVAGTIGASANLNSMWSISIDGGVRHSWSQFSHPEETEESSTGTGKISLRYTNAVSISEEEKQRFSAELSYARDIMPASGYGGATLRNTVSLSASYKTPRGWSATANVGYYTNKSDSGEYSVRKIDTKTFFVTPGVRYQFSEDIALDASYDYTLYKEDESDAATRAHRHLFLIRLYIQHALLSK